MKKVLGIVVGAITLALMCVGCSKEKKVNENKVVDDKTTICNWLDNDSVKDEYKLDKLSFSKDNNIAVLSYVTMKMGAKLDEYYTVYYSELEGDAYTIPEEISFDSDYYVITAQITYDGNEMVFTGLPAKQAETIEGFNNGCNLYIGDFKSGKVSNVRQLDFKEEGMRYYIISTLEDGSIVYNTYDDKNDKFVSKIAIKNGKDYVTKDFDMSELNEFYNKTAYIVGDKAFIWIADATDRSFRAYLGDYKDGKISGINSLASDFMYNKDYGKFYSAVGFDRTGGIYIYEAISNKIELYRCAVENFVE